MKKAGTVNPADPQQPQFPVPTPVQHCAGVPEPVQFAGSPGVPGHGLTLLPHAMHAVCWQLAVFVFGFPADGSDQAQAACTFERKDRHEIGLLEVDMDLPR